LYSILYIFFCLAALSSMVSDAMQIFYCNCDWLCDSNGL